MLDEIELLEELVVELVDVKLLLLKLETVVLENLVEGEKLLVVDRIEIVLVMLELVEDERYELVDEKSDELVLNKIGMIKLDKELEEVLVVLVLLETGKLLKKLSQLVEVDELI